MHSPVRLLAAIFGLAVALATPAVSVAHAYAHHEASEHAQPPVDKASAGLAVDGNAIGMADQHGHGHPVISPGLCNRVLQLLPALAPTAASFQVAITLSDRASRTPPAPFESPPQLASTLPAQPRAPPIL
jgi:hypothetical protein